MLLRTLSGIVRYAPSFLKEPIKRNRTLDPLFRKAFARLGRGEHTIEMGPLKGLRLVVTEHTSHSHLRGDYELAVTECIARQIKPGMICYDLGASIGYISLLMANTAKHVYAFEPAPHAAADMKRHLQANRFTNVDIVPMAVSDSLGIVEFSLTDVAYGSAIQRNQTGWETIQVKTTTLDQFVRDGNTPPDFIKIDVENEEARVLAGASEVIRKHRPVICCELHSSPVGAEVMEILAQAGYAMHTLDGDAFELPPNVIPGEVQLLATPRQ